MSKQDIKDFIEYCGINATASTLKKISIKITAIDKHFKGHLDNLTLKEVHSYLSDLNKKGYANSTKNDYIKIFKRFLKWRYKDWNERFDELKDMKGNSKDQRKLSKEDLLTPDEMNMIINSTDSMKYKTLLMLFKETAGRPEELLKLKWKNINLDNKEVKLHSSKTDRIRTIPINETIGHLKRYRKECFNITPKADDRVFNLGSQALTKHLDKTERKLNFHKHLYAYLWRHSILTKMIRELTPKVYEMYAGHNLETGMKVYAHLDNEDLREELNKINNIEELTPEDKEEIKKLRKEVESLKRLMDTELKDLKEQMKLNASKVHKEIEKNYNKKNKKIE